MLPFEKPKETPEQELRDLEAQLARLKSRAHLSPEAQGGLEKIEERVIELRGQIDPFTIESEDKDEE